MNSSKLGPGPKGPRTPQGKARSSQNAVKHGLFSQRVSPEEEKEANRLHRALRKELRLDGFEDELFGSDLVLTMLKKTRLDKHTCEEFRKADVQAFRDQVRRFEFRWSLKRNSSSSPNRAHPEVCILLLESVKASIERCGLKPEEDLRILDSVFSRSDGEKTFLGISIIFLYNRLKHAESAADGQSADSSGELKTQLLKAIEDAIELEQVSAHWEALNERKEPPVANALLPDAIADRILRCETAIEGHFIRVLDGLERYRRLRKCSS